MSAVVWIIILIVVLLVVLPVILFAAGVFAVSKAVDSTPSASAAMMAPANTCGACVGGTCCNNNTHSCPDLGCCPAGWICDCENKRCVNLRNEPRPAAMRYNNMPDFHGRNVNGRNVHQRF